MIETAKPQENAAPVQQKRRFGVKILIALIFAVLIIAALLTVFFISGDISVDGIKRTWTVITGGAGDVSFVFEDGFDAVFADLGSAVVASGNSGIIVYNADGAEIARDVLVAQNPAVVCSAGIAVSYGIGGRGIRVIDETGIIASLTFENNIVSCSIGSSNSILSGGVLFAVCTESTGSYKGDVAFYKIGSAGPEKIYSWFSGEGYILSAEISPGNNEFAILTLNPRGGRIVLMRRDSTELQGEYILDGAAIIEMGYLKSGKLIARTADSLLSIDNTGNATEIYSFDGKTVAGYCDDSGSMIALYFESASGGNSSGQLVVLDERGNELGKIDTSRSFVWIASYADRIAVLWEDGLGIYDRNLRLITSYPEATGMHEAYARGASRAVVFGSREGMAFSGKIE